MRDLLLLLLMAVTTAGQIPLPLRGIGMILSAKSLAFHIHKSRLIPQQDPDVSYIIAGWAGLNRVAQLVKQRKRIESAKMLCDIEPGEACPLDR